MVDLMFAPSPGRLRFGSTAQPSEASVKALTIKSIPEPLYRQLKKTAALHRRSINSEVLLCLERALLSRTVTPGELLARADAVRERIQVPYLTGAALRAAKDAGRP